MTNSTVYPPFLLEHLQKLVPFWDEAGFFLALIEERALSATSTASLVELLSENFEAFKEHEMSEYMQSVHALMSEIQEKERIERANYTWELFL